MKQENNENIIERIGFEKFPIDASKDFIELTFEDSESSESKVLLRRWLTFEERNQFIKDVVSVTFFKREDGTKEYHPENKKLLIDLCIVGYFTNIGLPEDYSEAYTFLNRSNIIPQIIDAIGKNYIDDIVRDIDDTINFEIAKFNSESKFELIADRISSIMDTLEEGFKNLDEVQMAELFQNLIPEMNS